MSHWKKSDDVPSLAAIMDEELARNMAGGAPNTTADDDEALARMLQEEELARAGGDFDADLRLAMELQATLDLERPSEREPLSPRKSPKAEPAPQDFDDDAALARALQEQFDAERNEELRWAESRQNTSSKVRISMAHHMVPNADWDDDDIEDESDQSEDDEAEYGDQTTVWSKHATGKNVTKHDAKAASMKNTQRLEGLQGVSTGTVSEADLGISNKVFNELRATSRSMEKAGARLKDKGDVATYEGALDRQTRIVLFKMINAGLLAKVNGIISTGKEANVYHAIGGSECDRPELAIKIYKITLSEFKNRQEYIADDFGFNSHLQKSRTNTRKLIYMWAEKERENLGRLYRAGIPCPLPIRRKGNILVMEFLGEDHYAAPLIRDVALSTSKMAACMLQVVSIMHTMYNRCQLVHADLSEYNLLYFKKSIYVIDVGQAVEKSHSHAFEFLLRDCTNVIDFFGGKHDVPMPSAVGLFTIVTDAGIMPHWYDMEAHRAEIEARVLAAVEESSAAPQADDKVPFELLKDIEITGQRHKPPIPDPEEEEEIPEGQSIDTHTNTEFQGEEACDPRIAIKEGGQSGDD